MPMAASRCCTLKRSRSLLYHVASANKGACTMSTIPSIAGRWALPCECTGSTFSLGRTEIEYQSDHMFPEANCKNLTQKENN